MKKVPVMCPICARITFFESLGQISTFVHDQWQMMSKFGKGWADAYKNVATEVGTYNSLKKLRAAFDEKGYVVMFCPNCMADASEKMYRDAGIDVIRIGNYIFDKKFYDENEDYILKTIMPK